MKNCSYSKCVSCSSASLMNFYFNGVIWARAVRRHVTDVSNGLKMHLLCQMCSFQCRLCVSHFMQAQQHVEEISAWGGLAWIFWPLQQHFIVELYSSLFSGICLLQTADHAFLFLHVCISEMRAVILFYFIIVRNVKILTVV